MKNFIKVALSALFVAGMATSLDAVAQGAPPDAPGSGAGPSSQMQAAFKKLQPVFDMSQEIGMFPELDKAKGLAFTSAQAKVLVPILKDLANRTDLKPNDADTILAKIEDKILTAGQLKWLDTTILARQEQARQRAAARAKAGGTGGGFIPGVGGGFGGGNRAAGGQNGQGNSRLAMVQAIQSGKPFNPFKFGRTQQALTDLIATLSRR